MTPLPYFALAAVAWLTVSVRGPQGAATPAVITAPGPQAGHSLVYDDGLGRVVMIGGMGASATGDAAALWTWSGRAWDRIENPGLPRRSLAGAAYDARRKRLVVFGGRVARGFTGGDTWTWDARTWREESDTSVGIRNHHSMAYDERRGRTILYGGIIPPPNLAPAEELKQRGTWQWPADTWEWDGARWHRMATEGPGSRSGTALAYDARRRTVVLFGGVAEDGLYRTGTWTWNGAVWRQVAGDGPSPRASHQMAYDSRADAVFLYGGGNRTGRLEDLWRSDGRQWTEIAMTAATPGPRNGHAMAYDRARRRLVLYGGYGSGSAPLGDTWEFDGTQWREIK